MLVVFVFCFFVFLFFFFTVKKRGGIVSEWLERWTYDSEAPSSSPALTTSWVCSL